jgi:hypothetical protein
MVTGFPINSCRFRNNRRPLSGTSPRRCQLPPPSAGLRPSRLLRNKIPRSRRERRSPPSQSRHHEKASRRCHGRHRRKPHLSPHPQLQQHLRPLAPRRANLVKVQRERGEVIEREAIAAEIAQACETLALMRQSMPARFSSNSKRSCLAAFSRILKALQPHLLTAVDRVRSSEEQILRNLTAIDSPPRFPPSSPRDREQDPAGPRWRWNLLPAIFAAAFAEKPDEPLPLWAKRNVFLDRRMTTRPGYYDPEEFLWTWEFQEIIRTRRIWERSSRTAPSSSSTPSSGISPTSPPVIRRRETSHRHEILRRRLHRGRAERHPLRREARPAERRLRHR